jgi:hypothetical protein
VAIMPLNMGERPSSTKEAHNEQDNTNDEEFLEDLMDAADDDEEEDDHGEENDNEDDEEIEFAYQCDFKKRNPPNAPCQNTSLLSNLLSSSSTTANNSSALTSRSEYYNSKPIPINMPESNSNTLTAAADPLSESLKRNIEWEHSQSLLRKYKNIKKARSSSSSLTDNFSRW